MTFVIVISAAVALIVFETFRLVLMQGRCECFDEAVDMFEEEIRKWEKDLSEIR